MAERPDLDHRVPILRREVRGATIAGFVVRKPVVLRVAVEGDPASLIAGRRIEEIERRGPFVRFALGGEPPLDIAVNPMLAGRFAIARNGDAEPKDLALALALARGRSLRYRDEKLRDFLKVRGRHKEPCPRCGTKIRKCGVRGFDAFFCPDCQPETRRSGIVDWRALDGG